MPLQGSLEETGLAEVLQLLALGRKTGCIDVASGPLRGEIYLDAGTVTWAAVTSRRDRLGDRLLARRRITSEQLQQAVAEQARRPESPLADILRDAGFVDRGDLAQAVQHQVEESIYFMFTWTQGEFTFTADRTPPSGAFRVSLRAEPLLLEGGRRVDDWSLIRKKIPSFDLMYQRTPSGASAATAHLTEDQQRILPLLDGRRDVNSLLDRLALSEFDAGKAMCGLVMAGYAQLVERRVLMRHLEPREMLAYALREAQFVDPVRRKEAARHIADCVTCANRLRSVARESQATEAPRPVGRARQEQVLKDRPTPVTPPAEAAPSLPSPAPARRSSEIVWLTTPDEANELVSTRRSAAPPPVPAAVPRPVVPPVAEPAAPAVAASPVPPIVEKPTPRVPIPVSPAAEPAPRPRSVRRIVAAGAIAAVVIVGYVVMRSGTGTPARPVASVPSPGPAPPRQPDVPRTAPAAAAPPPAPAPAVVASARRDTVTRVAAATRTPPRSTAPAPRPAPAPEVEVAPAGPDVELASGGWTPINRADAMSTLGGAFAAIPGLRIESITTSSVRGVARVRVAQIARTGQRIVLTQVSSGVPAGGGAPTARATQVQVSPPDAGGLAMGTASLGNLFITARSTLEPDALRLLLQRLAAARQP